MMLADKRIFIAGDRSPIAIDLKMLLQNHGCKYISGCNTDNLDLRDSLAVDRFFEELKPEVVFLVAAWCATDIDCQKTPFDVCNDNLLIAMNVIKSSLVYNVSKIIYISSDSVLPWDENGKTVDETSLFSAPVKERIEPYALAKLMGTRLASYANKQAERQMAISLILPHIYGNIKKGLFYSVFNDVAEAKGKGLTSVKIWGNPNLEYNFLHTKDVADAAYFVAERDMHYDCYIVAPLEPISKKDLATIIAREIGYNGEIVFDANMPVKHSVMASSKRLRNEGFEPKISLEDGIHEIAKWYSGM